MEKVVKKKELAKEIEDLLEKKEIHWSWRSGLNWLR
jgi:hypothetical protein